MTSAVHDHYVNKTKHALVWTHLLSEPFISIYALLPVIMTKYLGASAFQIALLTMLRPTVSVFAFYWSAPIASRRDRLLPNLLIASVLAVAPFLLLPWYHGVSFLIFAAATYSFFYRARIPALMEILKLNVPKQPRERLFSSVSALAYGEGLVVGIIIGMLLDRYLASWPLIFCVTSLFVMAGVAIQSLVPVRGAESFPTSGESCSPTAIRRQTPLEWLTQPWKDSFRLLRERPDFAHFQKAFMISASGLMFAMPAIPFFLTDMNLSFTELVISFNLCKGLGFVCTSPLWARALKHFSIQETSRLFFICFALFFGALLLAPMGLAWLFTAYLCYGVAQAGSHLVWHLSGSFFCGKEDSSPFSTVGVLMVGLRGAIAPFVGALFCDHFGPYYTLAVGMLTCLYGSWYVCVARFSPAPYRVADQSGI